MAAASPLSRFNKGFLLVPSGCWEWQKQLNVHGYGVFNIGKRTIRVHRWAYEHFIGSADGLGVLHKCNNRKCVNPSHLYAGTQADNMRDRSEAGWTPARGGECHSARLNENDVRAVREMARLGANGLDLAWFFGVSDNSIHKILKGKSWKHI